MIPSSMRWCRFLCMGVSVCHVNPYGVNLSVCVMFGVLSVSLDLCYCKTTVADVCYHLNIPLTISSWTDRYLSVCINHLAKFQCVHLLYAKYIPQLNWTQIPSPPRSMLSGFLMDKPCHCATKILFSTVYNPSVCLTAFWMVMLWPLPSFTLPLLMRGFWMTSPSILLS